MIGVSASLWVPTTDHCGRTHMRFTGDTDNDHR
jgi:hypothetical protein